MAARACAPAPAPLTQHAEVASGLIDDAIGAQPTDEGKLTASHSIDVRPPYACGDCLRGEKPAAHRRWPAAAMRQSVSGMDESAFNYPLPSERFRTLSNVRQQKFARSGPDALPLPDDSRIGVNSLRRMFAGAPERRDGSSSRLPNKAYETASRREAESFQSKTFPPYVRYRTEHLNETNDNNDVLVIAGCLRQDFGHRERLRAAAGRNAGNTLQGGAPAVATEEQRQFGRESRRLRDLASDTRCKHFHTFEGEVK